MRGPNAGDIKYQILSSGGRSIGAKRTANASTSGLHGAPQGVGLAEGGLVIVWDDFASDANGDIRLQRIAAINTRRRYPPSFRRH